MDLNFKDVKINKKDQEQNNNVNNFGSNINEYD
jgi:hypothetical protein